MADDKKEDKQPAADPTDPRGTQVHGFQEGAKFARMPRTPADFANLLDNPDKPAQHQSAPSPEQLNPQLFT